MINISIDFPHMACVVMAMKVWNSSYSSTPVFLPS